MLIKIHRFLGISLVFFILVLSVTGTLIQHAEIFNIRNNYAPSSIAKNFYDIQPCKIYSYQFNKKWISICNQDLFFDIKKVASNVEKVTSIIFFRCIPTRFNTRSFKEEFTSSTKKFLSIINIYYCRN